MEEITGSTPGAYVVQITRDGLYHHLRMRQVHDDHFDKYNPKSPEKK